MHIRWANVGFVHLLGAPSGTHLGTRQLGALGATLLEALPRRIGQNLPNALWALMMNADAMGTVATNTNAIGALENMGVRHTWDCVQA